MTLKAVKFYGPVSAGVMLVLEKLVSCEALLDFYRYTDGCIIVNSNGEIHMLRAMEFLKISKARPRISVCFRSDPSRIRANCTLKRTAKLF